MYTTPGEDSELSSESRFLGCTPLLERTVGSVRRVSLRGSGMYTTPGEDSGINRKSWFWGCTPLLERSVDSVRRVALWDVHRSWRGQWAQFGESLSGIYTTPGEDSGINRESWMYTTPGGDSGINGENLWNTHQSWRKLGSTRTVSFEDTHHSGWRFSFGINTAYIAGASHIFTKTQQQQQQNYSVKYRLAHALRKEKQHSVYVLFQWSLLQSKDETSERRPPDSRRPTHGLNVCDLTSVKRKPSTPSKKASSCCQPSRSRKRRSFEPQTKSVT